MNILETIPLSLDPQEIAKKLRLSPRGHRQEMLDQLLLKAREVIRPRAAYRVAYVFEKGEDTVKIGPITFKSRILRVNLDQAGKVFPYVVTLGEEFDRETRALNDMLLKYYLEELANYALGQAQEFLLAHLAQTYALGKPSRMNPGSLPDWPLEQQRNLFALLGPERIKEALGVSLTSSFLMVPVKSVSGIVFQAEKNFKSCQLCPRGNCLGRRAAYDKKLLSTYE